MGKPVQKMVTEDSFVNGVLVPAGQIATYDSDQLNGKEPHIHAVPDIPLAVIEMAPIGPTGPNPVQPQQISPDTVQGPGGGYMRPGATIVGEVTRDADQRLQDRMKEGDTSEGDITEEIAKLEARTAELRAKAAKNVARGAVAPVVNNDDDELVEGTVKDVVADLGAKDDAALDALEAAEKDREKPRKGVLDAIKAERTARATS